MTQTESTINVIEMQCESLRADQDQLSAVMGKLNAELEKVKRKHLADLRTAVSKVASSRVVLRETIDDCRDLFAKPRSRMFHGIKVGLRKGKGNIDIADEAKAIAYIEEHFHDDVQALVKTTKRVNKAALGDLEAADLRRAGITLSDTGDEIVIKDEDGEIEKMVNKMIKEQEREALGSAA